MSINVVLFGYELPLGSLNSKDIKSAYDFDVIIKCDLDKDSLWLLGSFNSIKRYLNDYIGIEVNNDHLYLFDLVEHQEEY